MNKLPAIADLTIDQSAILIEASRVLSSIGVKILISVYPKKDGGADFTFIFNQLGGTPDMASASAGDISAAFDGALPKYREYSEKPRPITSAVAAVNMIRERVSAGEDVNAVLADIKVA